MGVPELVAGEDGEAMCAYALDGLEIVRGPVRGEGTLQALFHAMQMIGVRLHDHFAHGVRVAPGGDEPEEERDPLASTANLMSMLGPLVRAPGTPRGPADPHGEIADLERKAAEMVRGDAEPSERERER